MPEVRRKYDPEFREGAVRIVRETNKAIAQVADDLGIHPGTLGNWVKRDRLERGETEGLSVDERAGLHQLERENAELRMERDVPQAIRGPVGQGGDAMTVASFIVSQRTEHGVPHALCCRALDVPSSTFYKWRDHQPTPRQARRASLDEAVRVSFDDSGGTPGTYGSPRVWKDRGEAVEGSLDVHRRPRDGGHCHGAAGVQLVVLPGFIELAGRQCWSGWSALNPRVHLGTAPNRLTGRVPLVAEVTTDAVALTPPRRRRLILGRGQSHRTRHPSHLPAQPARSDCPTPGVTRRRPLAGTWRTAWRRHRGPPGRL
jgi:transposase